MSRLDDLDAQIAQLQAQRDELLASERKQALEEVKRAISRFGFTAEELAGQTVKRKRRTKAEMAALRSAEQQ